jgi:hypothetical protein
MKKNLLRSTTMLATLAAFANANAASKIFICATAQNVELDQSDYEALTWVEIKGIGSLGETGKSTNILNYPTWDTTVTQKAKGLTDAGSPDLEVARIPTDPGQMILRAAGAVGNNNNYAIKILRADGTTATNGSVMYNRGLVTGPKRPNGRNEDFDIEMFTFALQQEEIVVNPLSAGVSPYVTANPAITGTAEEGETLTVSTGTWAGDATITYTYDWYANNVRISGATASTYELTAAEVGKRVTARVTATNASGNASATTAPTAAVIA